MLMTMREIRLYLVFTLDTSVIITDLCENWCRNSVNSWLFLLIVLSSVRIVIVKAHS